MSGRGYIENRAAWNIIFLFDLLDYFLVRILVSVATHEASQQRFPSPFRTIRIIPRRKAGVESLRAFDTVCNEVR
jgi:hypothetical protein